MEPPEGSPATHIADDASIARLLIASVTDYAIFVLDPHGFVRTWNRGAERLKRYRAEEIIGRHFSTFYTDPDREAGLPYELLGRAERDGSAAHSGWRVRRDGTRFWGDVTITALREDDHLVGFAKVTRDLTERHEHEEELRRSAERERQAAAELQRLHRTRTRLLSAIIHDLTTPITVIRSSLQLAVEDPTLEGDLGALFVDAHRNAEDLEQLRAQLQEFARLEGGAVALRPARLELRTIADQVARDVGEILGAADVQVAIDPTLTVLADELALRRILTNLVTNAARYSPDDEPIRIVAAPADTADMVAVGVVDRGPGIDPEDRPRVFQDFWSGRGERRLQGGLGLGLSIVRGYVEEHGGRVWVDSTIDRGATFWFTLPRTDVAGAPLRAV